MVQGIRESILFDDGRLFPLDTGKQERVFERQFLVNAFINRRIEVDIVYLRELHQKFPSPSIG